MEPKPPNYFEAILQLRNPKEGVQDFIAKECQNAQEKGVFISKVVKVPNGFDYFLSSKKFTRTLGHALQNRYTGELLTTARIHTRNRQTSKDVYRLYVLFRMHDFKVGDIIKIKGKLIKITYLGSKIQGFDTETGKKYSFLFSDVD